MAETYFEPTMYSSLSNKELIEKQKMVDSKLDVVVSMPNVDETIVKSLNTFAELISDEIMRRLEDGTMDEDELERRDFIRKYPTTDCDGCGEVHNTEDMHIGIDATGEVVLVLCKKCAGNKMCW